MGFYEEISKYYDYIFPVSNQQISFIANIAKNPPKCMLDIACGTGGYSIEFAKLGYDVTAVDLDEKMVSELRNKTKELNCNLNFAQGNMLELNKNIEKNDFDVAFCIGNSIVHLNSLSEIKTFLKNTKGMLKSGASLIIQTINYDRIISKEVKGLPTIKNDSVNLEFERSYMYNKESNEIIFKTTLSVDNKTIENEISLYPLLFDELMNIVKEVGFKCRQAYGDFKGTTFEKENSYALVLHLNN